MSSRLAVATRLPSASCSHIDNAIDLEQYVRRRPLKAAKEKLGFDSQRLVIGAVGMIAPPRTNMGTVSSGASTRTIVPPEYFLLVQ